VTSSTAGVLYRVFSVNAGLGMMFLDTILYTLIALYVEQILPSRFRASGVPKPWYFPCMPRFWRVLCGCGKPPSPVGQSRSLLPYAGAGASTASSAAASPASSPSVEQPDAELLARDAEGRTVSVSHLRKEFNTPDGVKVAVDNVDLTFYEGQISVLLGRRSGFNESHKDLARPTSDAPSLLVQVTTALEKRL
jgi:ATP-binding cassette, subfamily A (ABC1), member 3